MTQGLSAGTEIPEADLLIALAEAVVARDADCAEKARDEIQAKLGNDALVDAAATAAAFHGFVRIADAIGIPYTTAAQGVDAPELRQAAGINEFHRIRAEG